MKKTSRLFLMFSVLTFSIACYTTPAERGAMGGGLIGAAAGQIIGGDTEATLIGAGLGAIGGALTNDYIDQQKTQAYYDGYGDARYHRNSYSYRPYEVRPPRTYYYYYPPPPPPVHTYYAPPFPVYSHFHFFID